VFSTRAFMPRPLYLTPRDAPGFLFIARIGYGFALSVTIR
jgi:hypothetical protein